MKSCLLATVASIGLAALTFVAPAYAVLIPTTNTFFTAPDTGTLRFTYAGFSAADTDIMRVAVNGMFIFQNNTTPVATVINIPITAGQQLRLQLNDVNDGNTWFSGTAENSDGAVHLQWATVFSDFGIGSLPVPVTTNCVGPSGACYLGWEDLPFPFADADYNDLVFALQFFATPAQVPEPASLSLLGAALVGMSWLACRRRKTV